MSIKTIKLILGSVLLLAAIGVLLSLTAFSDIYNLEKVNVEKRDGISLYTDKKARPLSGIIIKESQTEKGARINIPVKDGIISGTVKQFDGDAKKIAEYPFVNGQLEGAATFYDRDGNVTGVSMFSGGKKNGKEVIFYGDKPAVETIYESDAVISISRSLGGISGSEDAYGPLPYPDIP